MSHNGAGLLTVKLPHFCNAHTQLLVEPNTGGNFCSDATHEFLLERRRNYLWNPLT